MLIFSFLFEFLSNPFSLLDIVILIIFFILTLIIFIAVVIASISTIADYIKQVISSKQNKRLAQENPLNLLTISGDEFFYLQLIMKEYGFNAFKRNHIASSADDIASCNKLVNRGAFVRNKDGSYKITQAGINMLFAPQVRNKSLKNQIINKILPKKSKNP